MNVDEAQLKVLELLGIPANWTTKAQITMEAGEPIRAIVDYEIVSGNEVTYTTRTFQTVEIDAHEDS
jgi:hypothetical protein